MLRPTETLEKNKLIAKFMGMDIIFDGISYHFYYINEKGCKSATQIHTLYESSWNWLMPVVHKCLAICNDLMLDEWESGFSDAFLSCSIATLYKEVTDFIEWYNKEIK